MSNPVQFASPIPGAQYPIIDGVSDVLKIVATGTLTTTAVAGTPATSIATAILTSGTTYPLASMVFLQFNDNGQNAGQQCPNWVISNAGAIAYAYEGYATDLGGGQCKVTAKTIATTAGSGGTQGVYRWYVLAEPGY